MVPHRAILFTGMVQQLLHILFLHAQFFEGQRHADLLEPRTEALYALSLIHISKYESSMRLA